MEDATALANLTDAQPRTGGPLFSNPTLRNFAPRIGFAWDPLSSGFLVISSSFGIFDVLPLPYQMQSGELFSAPFYVTGSATTATAGFATRGFPQCRVRPGLYFDHRSGTGLLRP